jgi:hypothetical protein
MLLVATGKPGRLVGFLLFELNAPWFSDGRRVTETCIFVEPGHRRSIGARELRKFAEERRKEGDGRKPEAAPTVQKAPVVSQNGTGATVAAKPVDSVEALLKTLAASSRPEPAMAPAPPAT